jgi:RNA polymerase sigma factor (sigma-70 family)
MVAPSGGAGSDERIAHWLCHNFTDGLVRASARALHKRHHHQIDDLVQEALHLGWLNYRNGAIASLCACSFEDIDDDITRQCRAYLLTILTRLISRFVRRQHWLLATPDNIDIASTQPQPSAICSATEESERLRSALDLLPYEHRVPLCLFYFEEMSYEQIADALEISIGTVKSRIFRAKQRLRELLPELE